MLGHGLLVLATWPPITGLALVIFFESWLLDRMVWLQQNDPMRKRSYSTLALQEDTLPTTLTRQRVTTAPRAALESRLRETEAWPQWSDMISAVIEKPGPNGPGTPGEIRIFTRAGTVGRELVLESSGNTVLTYQVLQGIPLKNYVGKVTVEDLPNGRRVTWSSSFTAPVPLTGWLFALMLAPFFDQLLSGLVSGIE